MYGTKNGIKSTVLAANAVHADIEIYNTCACPVYISRVYLPSNRKIFGSLFFVLPRSGSNSNATTYPKQAWMISYRRTSIYITCALRRDSFYLFLLRWWWEKSLLNCCSLKHCVALPEAKDFVIRMWRAILLRKYSEKIYEKNSL